MTRRTLNAQWLIVLVVWWPAVGGDLATDLLQFASKLQLADPTTLSGWQTADLPSTVCSEWTGVVCNTSSSTFALNLTHQGLSGPLGVDWFQIPSFQNALTSLDLSRNQLTGDLPADWSTNSSKFLQHLYLSRNNFTGSLPPQWTGLSPALTHLALDKNKLTSTLPPAWANGFEQLQLLNISMNNLTGSVPSEWLDEHSFGALQELWAFNCSLAGTLPAGSRQQALSTAIIQPGNVQLCGTLPAAFQHASNFSRTSAALQPAVLQNCGSVEQGQLLLNWTESFSNWQETFVNCRFFGWSQATLAMPCAWTGITCHGNNLAIELFLFGLNGTFNHSSYKALAPILRELHLDANILTDPLPPEWGQMFQVMTKLSFRWSNLVTTLPPEWGYPGAFPALYVLCLSYSDTVTGALPDSWGSPSAFQALRELDLTSTTLTSTLPASWANMTSMQYLYMPNTKLAGTLPSSWSGMPNMDTLYLQNNSLTGPLPAAWGSGFPLMDAMNLSENQLSGTIPAWGSMSGMPLVDQIDLRSNRLAGSLPQSLNNLPSLTSFQVYDNKDLCGAIRQTDLGPCRITAKRSPVAVATGAALGGLALIAVVVGIAAWLLRRRLRSKMRQTVAQDAAKSGNPTLLSLMGGKATSMLSTTSGSRAVRSDSAKEVLSAASSGKSLHWEVHPSRVVIHRLPTGQLDRLGAGAYGKVYRGILDDISHVAVKMLPSGQLNQRQVDAFLNEVSILHDCRHPHVLLLLGAWLGEDQLFMITELMEIDLWRALACPSMLQDLRWENKGKLIAKDIAQGLAYLSANDILHNDIKSPNILLNVEGRAKIADAGLAMVMQGQTHCSGMSLRGTFDWMAPELILEGRCTSKADVYSMGMVFWELATQERPTRGHNRDIAATDCPAEAAELIYACIARNPADRPTAKEVVQSLEVMQS